MFLLFNLAVTNVYINQVNLFLLFFFKRNITHPIFELMYPGRGFKINTNSAILKLNVKVFTKVKVESCTLYIGSLPKSGVVYFVHWFPSQKVEACSLYIGSLAKNGVVYFVHSSTRQKVRPCTLYIGAQIRR